ncbi:hypothetical protein RHMOL_Rhmol03G0034800 [Rhododendron molle]|uniref:Uncharacterized protein n=1 Tax=Rhododendron molle TaxID=49168 RepID=A0ACC0PA63_RHOML|nr:hypothetical protein RHMOL_Rhmol03G0034800 [Rhododendron molle]
MAKTENQENQPPPGYPSENPPTVKKKWYRIPGTKKRGEKGCLEACLAALCCCFVCEECC